MPKKKPAKTMLQTVERALSFMEFVADTGAPPTLKEIAENLRLNIATTYHLFNTLEARGYVVRNVDGGVRLGRAAAALYQAMADDPAHDQTIRRVIEQLCSATQETTYLTRLAGTSVVIQAIAEAPQTLRVSGLRVGFKGREHLRASGKAVLAFVSDARFAAYLKDLQPALSGQERKIIEDDLVAIRRRGFAIDNEKYERGICCLAAPYFRADGAVAGSVTISLPAVRFPKNKRMLSSALLDAASAVSSALHRGEVQSSQRVRVIAS